MKPKQPRCPRCQGWTHIEFGPGKQKWLVCGCCGWEMFVAKSEDLNRRFDTAKLAEWIDIIGEDER